MLDKELLEEILLKNLAPQYSKMVKDLHIRSIDELKSVCRHQESVIQKKKLKYRLRLAAAAAAAA